MRGLAQAQGEVVAVAEVAHRGDARAQLGGGGLRHRLQHGVVVAGGERGDRVEARVEREVHVGVDQPGQERGLAEVEQLGVGGRGPVRTSVIRPSSTSTSGSTWVVTPSKRRAARRAVRVMSNVVRAF